VNEKGVSIKRFEDRKAWIFRASSFALIQAIQCDWLDVLNTPDNPRGYWRPNSKPCFFLWSDATGSSTAVCRNIRMDLQGVAARTIQKEA
jgi:hypothetical protein